MTVKELIDKLQQFPAGTPIVVDGYENGYDSATDVSIIRVSRQVQAKWYDGEFDKSDEGDAAILISSAHRRAPAD